MIKIESLKDYIKLLNEKEFVELATKIYQITDFICEDYPKHRVWFFKKQLPAIVGNERNILFVRSPENSDEIISMACLKKDDEEKKICTLYVSDKCRGLGIGTAIIEESMKWLGTTKPLITLADYKLYMFTPLIEKYNWELTEEVSGLYNDKYKELCYNGTLTNNKQELYQKFVMSLQNRIDNMIQNNRY